MDRLLREFWPILVPTFLGFAGVYLALPRVRASKAAWGTLVGGVALALMVLQLGTMNAAWQERFLFLTFAAVALTGGFMLVTQKNPAHAALSFTLVIIATCGIFLLNGAPFLMAATIIIYAGAIIVTFLFVLMLAAQPGLSDADARSREPFLASLAGFILLGAMLCVIQRAYEHKKLQPVMNQLRQIALAKDIEEANAVLAGFEGKSLPDRLDKWKKTLVPFFQDEDSQNVLLLLEEAWGDLKGMKSITLSLLQKLQETGNLFQPSVPKRTAPLAQSPFSGVPGTQVPPMGPAAARPKELLPAANTEALGRSLFTDYLVPVLGAAILLLVATIGAIAIAGRRGEVLR